MTILLVAVVVAFAAGYLCRLVRARQPKVVIERPSVATATAPFPRDHPGWDVPRLATRRPV